MSLYWPDLKAERVTMDQFISYNHDYHPLFAQSQEAALQAFVKEYDVTHILSSNLGFYSWTNKIARTYGLDWNTSFYDHKYLMQTKDKKLLLAMHPYLPADECPARIEDWLDEHIRPKLEYIKQYKDRYPNRHEWNVYHFHMTYDDLLAFNWSEHYEVKPDEAIRWYHPTAPVIVFDDAMIHALYTVYQYSKCADELKYRFGLPIVTYGLKANI